MSHGGRLDRDATRSPPPVPSRGSNLAPGLDFTPVGPGSARINNLLNEEQNVIHSAPGSRNKGVGRGNYPRKPKEPTVQPFEQVHRHPELQPHPLHRSLTHGPVHESPELQGAHNLSYLYNAGNSRHAAPLTPHHIAPATGMLEGYWIPPNGSGVEHHASLASIGHGTLSHGASNKRARNPSAYQKAIEVSRRERLNYLLDRNMRTLQRAHARQGKRRGALADAWIKCSALTSGWNSEEDEPLGRWGGMDVVRTTEGNEHGDVGAKVGGIARALRRVGRKMGAGALIDRDRNILRSKGRRGVQRQEEESYGLDDGQTPTPPRDIGGPTEVIGEQSVTKEKKKKASSKRKSGKGVVVDDGAETVPTPAPAKGKKKGVKRAHDGKVKEKSTAAKNAKVPVEEDMDAKDDEDDEWDELHPETQPRKQKNKRLPPPPEDWNANNYDVDEGAGEAEGGEGEIGEDEGREGEGSEEEDEGLHGGRGHEEVDAVVVDD